MYIAFPLNCVEQWYHKQFWNSIVYKYVYETNIFCQYLLTSASSPQSELADAPADEEREPEAREAPYKPWKVNPFITKKMVK